MRIFRFEVVAKDESKYLPTTGFIVGRNYSEAVNNLMKFWSKSDENGKPITDNSDNCVTRIALNEIESYDLGILLDSDLKSFIF